MRHTTYSCDNCGRTISLEEGFYGVSIQGLGAARSHTHVSGVHTDLCADCFDKLPPAIRHGPKETPS